MQWKAEALVNGQWITRAECASKFVASLSLTRDELYAGRQTRLTETHGAPEMSIRTITTAVIDCDEPGCDEHYADTVDLTPECIARFAARDGWTSDTCEGGEVEYFCPEHSRCRQIADECHARFLARQAR